MYRYTSRPPATTVRVCRYVYVYQGVNFGNASVVAAAERSTRLLAKSLDLFLFFFRVINITVVVLYAAARVTAIVRRGSRYFAS